MKSPFVGKFKLESQEHFDQFLAAIGVGVAQRALAEAATHYVEFAIDGDDWTVTFQGLRAYSLKFKLGVESEHEAPDGRRIKHLFTLDGPNKLIQKELWADKTVIMTREVNGDDMNVVIELDDIRCTRKFKRT